MYTIEQMSLNQLKIIFSHSQEKEIAQWLFDAMQYQAKSSPYIVKENGQILSQEAINKTIEVYFQEDCKNILDDISYEKTFIGRNLVKFNLIADWYFNYFNTTRKKIEQNKLRIG